MMRDSRVSLVMLLAPSIWFVLFLVNVCNISRIVYTYLLILWQHIQTTISTITSSTLSSSVGTKTSSHSTTFGSTTPTALGAHIHGTPATSEKTTSTLCALDAVSTASTSVTDVDASIGTTSMTTELFEKCTTTSSVASQESLSESGIDLNSNSTLVVILAVVLSVVCAFFSMYLLDYILIIF